MSATNTAMIPVITVHGIAAEPGVTPAPSVYERSLIDSLAAQSLPEHIGVLVDGNRLPRLPMLAEAIIGGDAKVPAISAASILAKVHRDRWCEQIDAEYPQYGFAAHKGYGTAAHLAALRQHGPTPWHRRSFAPVAQALRQAGQEAAGAMQAA